MIDSELDFFYGRAKSCIVLLDAKTFLWTLMEWWGSGKEHALTRKLQDDDYLL